MPTYRCVMCGYKVPITPAGCYVSHGKNGVEGQAPRCCGSLSPVRYDAERVFLGLLLGGLLATLMGYACVMLTPIIDTEVGPRLADLSAATLGTGTWKLAAVAVVLASFTGTLAGSLWMGPTVPYWKAIYLGWPCCGLLAA